MPVATHTAQWVNNRRVSILRPRNVTDKMAAKIVYQRYGMINRRKFFAGVAATSLFHAKHSRSQEVGFLKLLEAIEAGGLILPGASGRIEAKRFETSSFAAAQPKVGKSKRKVSSETIRMITAFEVSGEKDLRGSLSETDLAQRGFRHYVCGRL
jgi:hypothetical protein